MATRHGIVLLTFLALLSSELRESSATADWTPATATFYGGSDGSGTMGGACGYGNLYNDGYGLYNTALSAVLFDDGASCGSCYEIVCDSKKDPRWCKKDAHITVTATNFCPSNYSAILPGDGVGWCNPPRLHFDLSQPAFEQIAIYEAGVVSVYFKRVWCKRIGGIRLTMRGNDYFDQVLVTNVGGSGVVSGMWIRGSSTGWLAMSRNWGMNWQSGAYLRGQSLSFRVQIDDGRVRTAYNVTPPTWQFGQTFQSSMQF